MEKSATHKQRKITDIFTVVPKDQEKNIDDEEPSSSGSCDIEDLVDGEQQFKRPMPVVNKRKRQYSDENKEDDINKSWKEVLGSPPPMGTTKEENLKWLEFQKQKWAHQAKQRGRHQKNKKSKTDDDDNNSWNVTRSTKTTSLGGFLKQAQKKLINSPWQIIQVRTCL